MRLLRGIRKSVRVRLSAAVVALAVCGLAILGTAGPAAASTTQLSMFEVPELEVPGAPDPGPTLQTLRSLGVNVLRVGVHWSDIAPSPNSRVRPVFNASDPNAYPPTSWATLDRLVSEAKNYGIQIDFEVTGGAPLWATQTGGPPCDPGGGWCYDSVFEPSASEYGQFVRAIATRYPSVHFWELWNEANWGPALTPQYDNSSVPISAYVYRGLLDAGWSALQATGHGADTIVVTSLSQDGSSTVGETGTTPPLVFVRTLWCATSSYSHLTGAAASQAGCPTTTAGYQQFQATHPALFQASGVGVHPYPYGQPPTQPDFPSPDGVEFPEIPQLTTALDKLEQMYGASKQMAAFNTEYGYRTRPNDTASFFATPDNAAAYINQAEYLSYKNPRIATYDQYELNEGGWFPTGLFFAPGSVACPGAVACAKPSFYSYRLPVWLPVTSTSRGSAIEVWGHARPAYFARLDTGQPQTVLVQWAPGSSGRFQTVKAVPTSDLGYIDTQLSFPGSGQVRLAWQYPPGDASLRDPLDPSPWIYSRVTNITVYNTSGYFRGVSKLHPKLGLTVDQGASVPEIASLSVRPPHGVKFRCVPVKKKHNACRGLAVAGGKVKSAKVTGGELMLNLVGPVSRVSITAGGPFVYGTNGLQRSLKKHKGKAVMFTLVITDTGGGSTTIPIRLKAK